MYPDLSYLLHDLLGTQPDNWTSIFKTFGIMLASALLSAGAILVSEMKRKEREGTLQKIKVKRQEKEKMAFKEAFLNGLIGFIMGFKVPYIAMNFEAFKADPSGTIFSLQGNWITGIIMACALGAYYYTTGIRSRTEATMEPGEYLISPYLKAGDILLVAGIFGIAGAKLFSIFENMNAFWEAPIKTIFSGSGLTVYGGFIIGGVAVYMYVKKIGIPGKQILDMTAPAIIMGYLVGRMGCHFAGDGDWGIVSSLPKPSWFILPDWMWSYEYPRNVLNKGINIDGCEGYYCKKLAEGVFPTPVYEIIVSTIIFAILWGRRTKVKIAGTLFCLFMILNGTERFFIEFIRVNDRYPLFNLGWSLSQWIALGFVICGIIGMIYLKITATEKKPSSIYDY